MASAISYALLQKFGAARDGLVVPALIRQLRKAAGDADGEFVRYGSTSQDVIDTALVLRLKVIVPVLRQRLSQAVQAITELEARFGEAALMGRTRLQGALQIRVSDRLAACAS